jgi:hypothetical protein
MTSPTNNLDALIQEASSEIRKAEEAREKIRRKRRVGIPGTSVAMFLAVLVWAYFLWSSAISGAQVRKDLSVLLQSARAQIEAKTSQDGRLPSSLPDVALAKVVRYEIVDANATPPRYRLTAEISGISERWTSQ